uniref:Uncharacterized protein n=1 Tax=Timema genevievae TaxID=629358 RepID=A0A7R9K0P6_TIMGE|nr:unnamed protein product [Timema genevievae]
MEYELGVQVEKKHDEIPIYNAVGSINYNFLECETICLEGILERPLIHSIWYPWLRTFQSMFLYRLLAIFVHRAEGLGLYVLFHRDLLVPFAVINNGLWFGWFRNWQVLSVNHCSDGGGPTSSRLNVTYAPYKLQEDYLVGGSNAPAGKMRIDADLKDPPEIA